MAEKAKPFSLFEILQKYELWFIILAAVLTVAGLMLALRLPNWMSAQNRVTVSEHNGIYDLTSVADLDKTMINLSPGSTYYPQLYLDPINADKVTPTNVNRYENLQADYLSQRFMLKLPDNSATYALTFTVRGRHAIRAYVNGVLAGQTGQLGNIKQGTEVWENNMTCYAAPQNGKMDIIVQTAQFYHYRSGARLAALHMEKAADTVVPRLSDPIAGFVVMGALLLAAALLLGIFFLLSRTRATLYFSLACLAMVLRECIQSQAWIYFPVSGNLVFMLEYMSVVLLTIFLSLYLAQYAINGFLKAMLWVAVVSSLAYGLILLMTDSIFYTKALVVYQILLIIVIIPGIGGLFWTTRRPNREQAAALYGIAVFYLAAVADIFMSSHLLGIGSPTISEIAMLIFVLAQIISLLFMNNRVILRSKETERRLSEEKAALEGLNRMKTEFLGNISHELKTPLTVVSSHVQQARNSLPLQPGLEDTVRSMQLIDGETARMALMVSQLLDVSRIDEGRMIIGRQQESMVEIIQSALDEYYPVFSKNHNTLYFKKEGDIPAVWCDRQRITQVLINLITNAVRHTREGRITVSVSAQDYHAVVTVSDTGEGMGPERISHLFERYYSPPAGEQNTPTGSNTGTGLGLYICKYIVEAHGGVITVASQPGQGTTVKFTLPATAPPLQEP